jgi:hypothetical protein
VTAFILRPENARERMVAAWHFACQFLELGRSARVTVEEAKPTRSLEQNSRMWALLTDVSRQVEWPVDGKMQRLSPEDWKDIFTAALRQGQRVAQGIEGGFVMLGCRTSRMKVGEMCELQDLIEAFGAERGVEWTEPNCKQQEAASAA